MNKAEKAYIEKRSRASQVNNNAVGKVTALDNSGRHTVELDGGRKIMVFSSTGSSYSVGEVVTLRFMGKDRRQAEIAGASTRKLPSKKIHLWR